MADNEPNSGYRFFVKQPDNTIAKQLKPPESLGYKQEQIRIKRSEQLNLSLPENEEYSQIVGDIKQDIIKVYKSVGIEITQDMFPELILSRKVTDNANFAYYRREHIAVVTVVQKLSFMDIQNIYHEVGHGISTRTEISKFDSDNTSKSETSTYSNTGLQTMNLKNNVETGKVPEEGLMQYMSIKYAATSQDKIVAKLRKEYLDRALELELIHPDEYPKTDDELYSEIRNLFNLGLPDLKGNLHTKNYANYIYALNTVQSLFRAANELGGKNEESKLLSKLLWARVNTTKKKELIHYIDGITKEGLGSKILTAPLDAEVINPLNMEIREAFMDRAGR